MNKKFWTRRVVVPAAAAVLGLTGLASLAPAASAQPASYSSCGDKDFCAYSGENGSGTVKQYFKCVDVVPFTSGTGSIYNHQSGGAKTLLYRYRSNGTTYLALTLNAGQKATWSWSGTADVRTC